MTRREIKSSHPSFQLELASSLKHPFWVNTQLLLEQLQRVLLFVCLQTSSGIPWRPFIADVQISAMTHTDRSLKQWLSTCGSWMLRQRMLLGPHVWTPSRNYAISDIWIKVYIKCLSGYDGYVFHQLKDVKHIGTIVGEKGHLNLFGKLKSSLHWKDWGSCFKTNTSTFHPV